VRQADSTECALLAGALIAATAATPLGAQELRGTVVQVDGRTPAVGVIALLRDARDSVLARVVTGERGAFALRAPGPGSVRVEFLRIGHRPTVAGPWTVAAGETQTVTITLADAPITLARVDVREKERCRVRPDSGLLVAQLFEEARKALLASATATSGAAVTATYARFVRTEDRRGRLVAPEERTVMTGPTTRPFASAHADTLARRGYVVTESDGVTFYAPDADVLLSDAFVRRHCIHVVEGAGARAASIGIGFRPVLDKDSVIDLVGTLWLDARSRELQAVEFGYERLPPAFRRAGVGGTVEFTRLPTGPWIVSRWAIRMPRATARELPSEGSMAIGGARYEYVLTGLTVSGGEVQRVRRGNEVLFAGDSTARDARR
jgi:hypothetical protein